jgi:hypothetical protein
MSNKILAEARRQQLEIDNERWVWLALNLLFLSWSFIRYLLGATLDSSLLLCCDWKLVQFCYEILAGSHDHLFF